MTPLSLAGVTEMDCVVSWNPLILDMPSPHREVSGAAAILRRGLYSFCRDISPTILDLEGYRPDARALRDLKSQLERAGRRAGDGDFIAGVTAEILFDDVLGTIAITTLFQLIDGIVYPLEVSAGDAPAALLALGGFSQ
jgi:hypothetical protein